LDPRRLPPPCIDEALDNKGEGVGFAATPLIFSFNLPNDPVIFSHISLIYILYFYLKNTLLKKKVWQKQIAKLEHVRTL
jgi:hypothetical protein